MEDELLALVSRLAATPREIAEVVWLRALGVGSEAQERSPPPPAPAVAFPPSVAPSSPPLPHESERLPGPALSSPAIEATIADPEAKRPGQDARRTPSLVDELPGLAERLAWRRALHRLARRTPVGTPALDVRATVAATAAAGGALEPVLRARDEPNTHLALVLDRASHVAPWRGAVRELARLAREQGSFASVRELEVGLARPEGAELTERGRPIDPRAFAPGGSVLVLVVSDGVSAGFASGALGAMLRALPERTRIAWAHPWGPGHWGRTPASRLRRASPRPLARGRKLAVALVPFSHVGLASLEPWAQERTGGGLPGRLLPEVVHIGPAPAKKGDVNWSERLRLLSSELEPEALLLLGLAAAVPGRVDLELLLTLGRRFVDEVAPIHLGLAIATGTLERVPASGERVILRFRSADVRTAARSYLTRELVSDVLRFLIASLASSEERARELQIPVPLLLKAQGLACDDGDARALEGAADLESIFESSTLRFDRAVLRGRAASGTPPRPVPESDLSGKLTKALWGPTRALVLRSASDLTFVFSPPGGEPLEFALRRALWLASQDPKRRIALVGPTTFEPYAVALTQRLREIQAEVGLTSQPDMRIGTIDRLLRELWPDVGEPPVDDTVAMLATYEEVLADAPPLRLDRADRKLEDYAAAIDLLFAGHPDLDEIATESRGIETLPPRLSTVRLGTEHLERAAVARVFDGCGGVDRIAPVASRVLARLRAGDRPGQVFDHVIVLAGHDVTRAELATIRALLASGGGLTLIGDPARALRVCGAGASTLARFAHENDAFWPGRRTRLEFLDRTARVSTAIVAVTDRIRARFRLGKLEAHIGPSKGGEPVRVLVASNERGETVAARFFRGACMRSDPDRAKSRCVIARTPVEALRLRARAGLDDGEVVTVEAASARAAVLVLDPLTSPGVFGLEPQALYAAVTRARDALWIVTREGSPLLEIVARHDLTRITRWPPRDLGALLAVLAAGRLKTSLQTAAAYLGRSLTWEDVSSSGATALEQAHLVGEEGRQRPRLPGALRQIVEGISTVLSLEELRRELDGAGESGLVERPLYLAGFPNAIASIQGVASPGDLSTIWSGVETFELLVAVVLAQLMSRSQEILERELPRVSRERALGHRTRALLALHREMGRTATPDLAVLLEEAVALRNRVAHGPGLASDEVPKARDRLVFACEALLELASLLSRETTPLLERLIRQGPEGWSVVASSNPDVVLPLPGSIEGKVRARLASVEFAQLSPGRFAGERDPDFDADFHLESCGDPLAVIECKRSADVTTTKAQLQLWATCYPAPFAIATDGDAWIWYRMGHDGTLVEYAQGFTEAALAPLRDHARAIAGGYKAAWLQVAHVGTADSRVARVVGTGFQPFVDAFAAHLLEPSERCREFKVLLGRHGDGKTHLLHRLRQRALDAGHFVSLVDAESFETAFDLGRALLRSIEAPGAAGGGLAPILRVAVARKRRILEENGQDPGLLVPPWAEGMRLRKLRPKGFGDALAGGLLAAFREDTRSLDEAVARLVFDDRVPNKKSEGNELLSSVARLPHLLGFSPLLILIDEAETALQHPKRRDGFLELLRFVVDEIVHGADESSAIVVLAGEEGSVRKLLGKHLALQQRLADRGDASPSERERNEPHALVRRSQIRMRDVFPGTTRDWESLGRDLVGLAARVHPGVSREVQELNAKRLAGAVAARTEPTTIRMFNRSLGALIELQLSQGNQRVIDEAEARARLQGDVGPDESR